MKLAVLVFPDSAGNVAITTPDSDRKLIDISFVSPGFAVAFTKLIAKAASLRTVIPVVYALSPLEKPGTGWLGRYRKQCVFADHGVLADVLRAHDRCCLLYR